MKWGEEGAEKWDKMVQIKETSYQVTTYMEET